MPPVLQKSFCFFILLFSFLASAAQDREIKSIANQPSSEAFDLLKDRKGYAWTRKSSGQLVSRGVLIEARLLTVAPSGGTATGALERRNTLTVSVTEQHLYLQLNGTSAESDLHTHPAAPLAR